MAATQATAADVKVGDLVDEETEPVTEIAHQWNGTIQTGIIFGLRGGRAICRGVNEQVTIHRPLPTYDELIERAKEQTLELVAVPAGQVRRGDRWTEDGPPVASVKTAKVKVTFFYDGEDESSDVWRQDEVLQVLRPTPTDAAERARDEADVARRIQTAEAELEAAKAALVQVLSGDADPSYALSWKAEPVVTAAENAKWWRLVRRAAEREGSWAAGLREVFDDLTETILRDELPRTTSRIDTAMAAIEHDARQRVRRDMRWIALSLLDAKEG